MIIVVGMVGKEVVLAELISLFDGYGIAIM